MLRIACAVLKERRAGIHFAFGFLCFVFLYFGRTEEVQFIHQTKEEVMEKMGKGSIISVATIT